MLENLPVLLETFESFIEAVQGRFGEQACSCNVTEIKVGVEAPDNVSGNKTLDRRHPHLVTDHRDKCTVVMAQRGMGQTFMSALESFPVHCWKLRPCLKRRRPGNGGTNAILSQRVSEWKVIRKVSLDLPPVNLI